MPVRPVYIVGAGALTAIGENLDDTWRHLLNGRCGIGPVTHFDTAEYGCGLCASIRDMEPGPCRSRMDVILERLFSDPPFTPRESVLITATTKAGIDVLENLSQSGNVGGDEFLPTVIADSLAKRLGLEGCRFNVSAACASSTIALSRGAGLIRTGLAESVLVCGFDMVTEFVFSGFSALKILDPRPCRPFDGERRGLSLGEGAAYVLLMNPSRADEVNAPVLGSIDGWGIAMDAAHITAPAKDGRGLTCAVRKALAMAGLAPEEIAAINAHGTGTVYNDRMELTAFSRIFEKQPVNIHSVKGAVGHTLGAAGIIDVVLTLKSLDCHVLPPTTGLRSPDEGAVGHLFSTPLPLVGDYVLSTNSGFGGINAAVIIGRGTRW